MEFNFSFPFPMIHSTGAQNYFYEDQISTHNRNVVSIIKVNIYWNNTINMDTLQAIYMILWIFKLFAVKYTGWKHVEFCSQHGDFWWPSTSCSDIIHHVGYVFFPILWYLTDFCISLTFNIIFSGNIIGNQVMFSSAYLCIYDFFKFV